jgi:hypothetical protein
MPRKNSPIAKLPRDTHIFVCPLTPRDTDVCYALAQVSSTPPLPVKELYEYLRRDSPTTLGVFTCPPLPNPLARHEEILLGYVLADMEDDDELLRMVGLWVLPEQETTGVAEVLLRGWCDRMRDAQVARKIVKDEEEDEKKLQWYKDAGFAVKGVQQEGKTLGRLVLDC